MTIANIIKSEVREVTLEQKVEELEKRMVALEKCIPKQPSAEEIANKICESILDLLSEL